MERLPYIDEHAITVDADREDTWSALPRVMKRIATALIAERAQTDETEDDYADTFEVPFLDGDGRTAEQAFRDGLGDKPGVGGNVVLWIHSHLLQFRLGPYSSPEHVIGWTILRSDRDEMVLAADGPLMRGQLRLRREDGPRAVLTTRLHYRHKIAASTVWLVVGPLHRTVAPRLMQRIARRGVSRAVVR